MALIMSRFSLISCLLLSLLLHASALAQIKIIPRERIDSVVAPRLSPDSASLKFETTRIVAAMNEDDAPAVFRFRFTNVSGRTIYINRLVSSCSCAAASVNVREVAPDAEAEIAVRYDPKGHPGKFERRIFVYSGDGNEPAAVLKLAVDVENGADISGIWPVQMGKIRLRRSEVTFDEGRKAVEKLRFINLSGRDMKLECETAFLPGCLSFRTVPETVADGEEGEIVISYDPSVGSVREDNKIILKGLGLPPSRSSLKVSIRQTKNE